VIPLLNFRKIWRTGSGEYFTLVGARFSGKSQDQFFRSGKRNTLQKSEKKLPLQNPLCAMCCENFGRFHRRKFKKITN